MSWKRLLQRFGKKPNPQVHSLDHKLVKSTQSSFVPRLSQIKYLGHFLSSAEKKIMWFAGILAVLSSFAAISILFSQHLALAPKEGGEYSEAMIGQPKLVNPLYASLSDVDTDLSSLIYTGLFKFNGELKLVPFLAESSTISSDQKIYEIKLKPNLTWSDGEPLTVDDIVFTFELIQNPEVGSPLATAFEGVTIEKINEEKIRFTLKEPFAFFNSSLTFGILPQHIWGEIAPSNIKLARQNLQPIGSGAWQFNKLLKDEGGRITSYELIRNEKFFDQKPYIKTIKFSFYNEYREAVEAMRMNDQIGLSFIPHSLEDKLNERTIATYPIKLPQYTALFLNQTEPSLKNADIREAMAMAIDKNRIVEEALRGYGSVIDSPILENSIGYNPNLKKIATDVNKANELLDKKFPRLQPEEYFSLQTAALLKDSQEEIDAFKKANSTTPEKITEFETQVKKEIEDSIRKNMDPEQTFYRKSGSAALEITITTVDTPEYSKTAELVSKMWETTGIKATIQKINSQQIIREIIKKRNYQVLLYGEIVGYDPDPYPFWHSSQTDYPGLNLSGYSNRNADKALEEARLTNSETKRDELYKKFQDYLVEDLPAIFLYSPLHTLAINKNVRGVEVHNLNNPADRFSEMQNWYVKTKWQWK